MVRYEFSGITHPGLLRSHNEDSYVADVDLGLWVIADGMGGHDCGEVASAIASTTIHRQITAGAPLRDAIEAAHQCIQGASSAGADGMGTTVVALQMSGCHYQLAWVGDSRAYRFGGGHLEALSRDHSLVQELIDAGAISETEAATHPQRHVITQSVGIREITDPTPGLVSGTLEAGDWLLLCSDGLTSELADDEIADLLDASHSVREATQNLLNRCLDRGARDNVTLIVVESPPRNSGAASGDGWLRRVSRRLRLGDR